jgi:hypothetical protein
VSERTGLGAVEVAILSALDSLGARPGRGYVTTTRVLTAVDDAIGLAPGYAYRVVLDLAQAWTVPVTLVSGQGNFGSRQGDPPANFRYTEARLSAAGAVALAAERGASAPVPVGFINGNTYRGGTRPPLRPAGVIAAIREAVRHPDVTDDDLIGIVGPPVFATGHIGVGDLAALADGREAEVRLEADVTVGANGRQVFISDIPAGISIGDAAHNIVQRAKPANLPPNYPGLARAKWLPLADLRDMTTGRHPGGGLLVCTPAKGTPPEELRARLLDIYGVYTTVRVKFPRPLATMIRNWAAAHAAENLDASLTELEHAITR